MAHLQISEPVNNKACQSCEWQAFVVQPGLEPGLTGPESVVLPLHHWTISIQQATNLYFVVQPGLEPGLTGPESVVLPLHHWTI